MAIELSIIPKPNEINDPHYEVSKPYFYYGLLAFYLLMTLNIVVQGNIFGGAIGFAFIAFLLMLDEWNNTQFNNTTDNHSIGKLFLSENNELKIYDKLADREFVVNIDKNTAFCFESYNGEIEAEDLSYGLNYIKNHGSNNFIVFNDEETTKLYYVHLKNYKEKKKFFSLIRWCYKKRVFVNEYSKGKVSFLGEPIVHWS